MGEKETTLVENLLNNPLLMLPLAVLVCGGGWFLSRRIAKLLGSKKLWLFLSRGLFVLLGVGTACVPKASRELLSVWLNVFFGFWQTPLGLMFLSFLGAVGATAVLVALFKGIHWYSLKLAAKIQQEKGLRLRALKFQRAQFLSEEQVVKVVQNLRKALQVSLNVLVLVLYLSGVLTLLPFTRPTVLGVWHAMLHAGKVVLQNFIAYSPNLLTIAVIAGVAFFVMKIMKVVFSEIGKGNIRLPHFYPEWAYPTWQLLRLLTLALALIIAFPSLPGASSPAFQGVSVFVGVLISLGSSSVVSHALAGLVLTYSRVFQLGDRIQVGDTLGDVLQKGILVTRLRTIKNEEVSIPNGSILGGKVINYSTKAKENPVLLHTTVTLGYDIPWRKIHEALLNAALKTEGLLQDPKPFVWQTALDDFYVAYQLNAATRHPQQIPQLYSDLHQNIQDSCRDAGIEILSPHYQAYRDGNESTIPKKEI